MRLIALLTVALLQGCSTYSTHLKTGCIWTCDQYTDSAVSYSGTAQPSTYTPNMGITGSQYNLPSGGYMVIRSGSTTSVIQTSKSR
jgi:hypothetical protein